MFYTQPASCTDARFICIFPVLTMPLSVTYMYTHLYTHARDTTVHGVYTHVFDRCLNLIIARPLGQLPLQSLHRLLLRTLDLCVDRWTGA